MNDLNGIHALSHTTWNCKYHIVLAPKYRRKVFYGKKVRNRIDIKRNVQVERGK